MIQADEHNPELPPAMPGNAPSLLPARNSHIALTGYSDACKQSDKLCPTVKKSSSADDGSARISALDGCSASAQSELRRSEVVTVAGVLLLWLPFVIHVNQFGMEAVSVTPLLAMAFFDKHNARRLLTAAMLLPAALVGLSWGLGVVESLESRRVDAALSLLDHGATIGCWRWFQSHPVAAIPLFAVYMSLGLFIVVALIYGESRPLLRTVIASAFVAPIFYFIFPAVGPAFVLDPTAPPNCVPSLHVTWAWLSATYLRKWQWAGWVFVALTACSTISTGQHYLVDVAAAVPFSMVLVRLEKIFHVSPLGAISAPRLLDEPGDAI